MNTGFGIETHGAPGREAATCTEGPRRPQAKGMRLTINGEAREVAPVATLGELIAQLQLDTRKVAVERNLEIVPRSLHGSTAVIEGDRIEIVHFIGGG